MDHKNELSTGGEKYYDRDLDMITWSKSLEFYRVNLNAIYY